MACHPTILAVQSRIKWEKVTEIDANPLRELCLRCGATMWDLGDCEFVAAHANAHRVLCEDAARSGALEVLPGSDKMSEVGREIAKALERLGVVAPMEFPAEADRFPETAPRILLHKPIAEAAAYCVSVCSMGEGIIGPFLCDKAARLREVVRPVQDKEERIDVLSGLGDGLRHAPFSAQTRAQRNGAAEKIRGMFGGRGFKQGLLS